MDVAIYCLFPSSGEFLEAREKRPRGWRTFGQGVVEWKWKASLDDGSGGVLNNMTGGIIAGGMIFDPA